MLFAVITTADTSCIGVVTCVMIQGWVGYLMAVAMVCDECMDISLIVGMKYWLWSSVV